MVTKQFRNKFNMSFLLLTVIVFGWLLNIKIQ